MEKNSFKVSYNIVNFEKFQEGLLNLQKSNGIGVFKDSQIEDLENCNTIKNQRPFIKQLA